MPKRTFAIYSITAIVLFFLPGISSLAQQTNQSVLLTKYRAVDLLLWYFQIPKNPDYTSSPPTFKQYFQDIWPANPHYASVNTACENHMVTCGPEKFFNGEEPVSLPAFLKMFYSLKYRNNSDIFQNKFLSYTGDIWYFPYLHEAIRSGILDTNIPLATMSETLMEEIFHRDTKLTLFGDIVDIYFDGLEIDAANITPERYYSLPRVNSIINQYYNVVAIKKGELATIMDFNKKAIWEEKIKKLSQMLTAFGNIQQILEENPLLYDPAVPDNVKEMAAKYGIREKIGESVYDYTKSPAYRRYNVTVALKKMNGIVLQPGEEFSFSKHIYDNNLREFKMGWVINKGEEEMAAGGGICGAATTVFEAAYRSGLQITERKEHSWYLRSFYPMEKIGLDATVFRPRPDMRFVNNTGAPLVMFVIFPADNIANFQIWGTKHFDYLTLEGPNRKGNTTKWIRTIWFKDGSVSIDELKSRFSRVT